MHWERHDQFFGNTVESFPHILDGEKQQGFLVFVQIFDQRQGVGVDDGAVHHFEVVDKRLFFIVGNGEYVHVLDGRINHGTFTLVIFEQRQFILGDLGLFKLQILRIPLHFFFQMAFYRSKIAFQNIFDLFDLAVIRFFRFQTYTGRRAVFNMVFQAGFELVFVDIFLRKVQVTGAQLK